MLHVALVPCRLFTAKHGRAGASPGSAACQVFVTVGWTNCCTTGAQAAYTICMAWAVLYVHYWIESVWCIIVRPMSSLVNCEFCSCGAVCCLWWCVVQRCCMTVHHCKGHGACIAVLSLPVPPSQVAKFLASGQDSSVCVRQPLTQRMVGLHDAWLCMAGSCAFNGQEACMYQPGPTESGPSGSGVDGCKPFLRNASQAGRG